MKGISLGRRNKKSTIREGSDVWDFEREMDFVSNEAYNLLRTNLQFSLLDKQTGHLVGVTSPRASEGKSLTAVNLAKFIAKAGKKVLLIDGDMRLPTVASKLKIKMVPGLSDYMLDMNPDYVQHGVLLENLDVLTSGTIPPNPAELMGQKRMQYILEDFSSKYDYVIVDLPPVIQVVDALAVSGYLDGLVVVLMHNHSRCRDAREAVRKLSFVRAKILGFVYNGMPVSVNSHYKGYNKYYERYAYGGSAADSSEKDSKS